jgi:hypothetical protein
MVLEDESYQVLIHFQYSVFRSRSSRVHFIFGDPLFFVVWNNILKVCVIKKTKKNRRPFEM